MCGLDVLDKGCIGIHVQVYVGCRVFDVVKSYLCVSVPVLDDDCGAFVRFVYDGSIIDDKLFQGLSLFVGWAVFGFCNVLSTSSLMSSTLTWCMWLWWYCCWCVWLVFAGGWLFFV